jgi:Holliday junction resolvasome RuvABC endonuclease subunit
MPRLIGIDPGGTTGLCIYDTDRRSWGWLQIPLQQGLWETLDNLEPDVVILERFTKRPNNKAAELMSLEVIGAAKSWCERNSIKLVQQTASDAKAVWPNKKLVKLEIRNLPNATPAHMRDAMRHVLLYLQKNMHDYTYVQKASPPA